MSGKREKAYYLSLGVSVGAGLVSTVAAASETEEGDGLFIQDDFGPSLPVPEVGMSINLFNTTAIAATLVNLGTLAKRKKSRKQRFSPWSN